MPTLHTDCRHFHGDRPCKPHKRHGVVCETCTEHYDPVQTRLLIVKLAAMGDVLRTTSFLPAIHRRWPGAHLTWITEPGSVPLLDGQPGIDRVVAFDGHVPLELAAQRFDVVLAPDAAPDAASLVALARGDAKIGFVADGHGVPVPNTPGAERWLAMGLSDEAKKANTRTYQALVSEVLELDYQREPPRLELDDADLDHGRRLATLHAPPEGGRIVGLNTGAGGRWTYKRWTEDGFHELITRLGREGHRVFLLGGPSEAERNARLAAASNGVAVDTGGNHPVKRFAGIVDACDVVVTGDTLAVHIAIARRVPSVVLFGPTSLHEIDVFERGEKLAGEVDCLCCYLPDCDVRPTCMDTLSVDRVHAAVHRCLLPVAS